MDNLELTVNEDIFLRTFQLEDADRLFYLVDSSRDQLRAWLPWVDNTKSPEDSRKFIEAVIEEFKNGKSIELGIFYKEELVGVVATHSISKANRHTSLGYWLATEYNGNGIMTAAVKALLNYLFTEKKLHRIVIKAATGNNKSKAIPEKLGFKAEGIERDGEWLYDHFVDLQVYSLLEDEFSLNAGNKML